MCIPSLVSSCSPSIEFAWNRLKEAHSRRETDNGVLRGVNLYENSWFDCPLEIRTKLTTSTENHTTQLVFHRQVKRFLLPSLSPTCFVLTCAFHHAFCLSCVFCWAKHFSNCGGSIHPFLFTHIKSHSVATPHRRNTVLHLSPNVPRNGPRFYPIYL